MFHVVHPNISGSAYRCQWDLLIVIAGNATPGTGPLPLASWRSQAHRAPVTSLTIGPWMPCASHRPSR